MSSCSGDDERGAPPEDSPLTEFLGQWAHLNYDEGVLSARFSSGEDDPGKQAEAQQLIAKCMADQGFEYVPVTVGVDEYQVAIDDAHTLADDDFAEQYGFGISTIRDQDYAIEDPNEEIMSSLSPEGLDAYYVALLGQAYQWSELDGPSPALEEQGCSAQGPLEAGLWHPDEFADLERGQSLLDVFQGDIFALINRFQSLPNVVEAIEAWSDCMAESGVSSDLLSSIDGPLQGIRDRFVNLHFREVEDGNFETLEVDPAELAELQRIEIDVAVADHACRVEHYNDVATRAQYELETEFVADHREDLEQFREYLIAEHGDEAFESD